MQRALSLLVLFVFAGCGGARPRAETTASSDPCRGSDLTLAQALASCRVDAAPATPSETEVRVTVDPVEVRAGETARVWMTFENASDAPRTIGFSAPPAFITTIWNGEERVDERLVGFTDLLAMLSGCTDDCQPVAVTLEPHGRMRAYVDVRARVLVLSASESEETEVTESDGGPIAPGSYELRIALPWSDADPSGTQIARMVHASFVVAP